MDNTLAKQVLADFKAYALGRTGKPVVTAESVSETYISLSFTGVGTWDPADGTDSSTLTRASFYGIERRFRKWANRQPWATQTQGLGFSAEHGVIEFYTRSR